MIKRESVKSRDQEDLFRHKLVNIIDMSHELVELSRIIDWDQLDAELLEHYNQDWGRPAKPIRLMVGLLMLQHIYNLSDELLVSRWKENPYFQYFCGCDYFQHQLPINPTSLIKFRRRISSRGCERILSETIKTAITGKVVKRSDLATVVVDTTIQEKNITYPTDTKLGYRCLLKLVALAKQHNVPLRQTYVRKSKEASFKASQYARSNKHKLMKKEVKKVRNYLGRVYREIKRALVIEEKKALGADMIYDQAFIEKRNSLSEVLSLASRIIDPGPRNTGRIYSLHEPGVICFNKGKTYKRFEFGSKVSVVATHKQGLVLSCEGLLNNPYDGHSLSDSLLRAEKVGSAVINEVYVDKGYRGHQVTDKKVYISGQKRGVTRWIRHKMKRRNLVEAINSSMKNFGRMRRNFLKGLMGDALNAILCGMGHNLRMILVRIRARILFLLFQILNFLQKTSLQEK